MLKACAKCGKIHEQNYICIPKAVPKNRRKYTRDTQADKFRNTQTWRRKAEEIKSRDFHLCRLCLINQYGTKHQYNSHKLSVHHIVSLSEDFGKRLDNGNLITLCSYHHERAERGTIPRDLLLDLAANPPTL